MSYQPGFFKLLLLIVFLSTQCFCLLQIRDEAHTKVNMNLSARTINFWHAWCEVTCYKTAGKCCWSAALCRPLASTGPAQAQKCAHGKSGLATQRHRSPANLSHLVPASALCTSNCDLWATPSGQKGATALERWHLWHLIKDGVGEGFK